MAPHDISSLDKQIKALNRRLKLLAEDDELRELLRLIRGPGWTTPSEHKFVTTIVVALDAHVNAIASLKTNLLEGSRQVGVQGVKQAA
jgi:hypothetical protein